MRDDGRVTRRHPALVGLALGGGGSKGAFQAGSIATLVGDFGLRPDVVTGTSVGSINVLVLAHARTPDEFPEVVDRMLAIWTSLRDESDMFERRPWLAEVTPGMRRAAGEVAAGRLRPELLLELARAVGPLRRMASDFRDDGDAAYSLAPVERRIRALQEPERIRSSYARIRLSAVALESGALRWTDETGALYEADATTPAAGGPVAIVDAVLASAAFSPAFPPRRMAGETYVDGGFRTVIPVRAARALGAGPVVAVACAGAGIGHARSMSRANVVQVAVRAAGATLAEIGSRDVEDLRRGPGLLVDPLVDVHGFLDVDPGRLAIDIDLGRMVAAERVAAVGGLGRVLAARDPGAPAPEDPDALAASEALTCAVTRLRLDAWAEEERLLVGKPRSGAALTLAGVRARKWLLRPVVEARAALPGPMPPGSGAVWSVFERHAAPLVVRDPWAGLSARNEGPVPAVDRDAYVPGPFTLVARGTGARWRIVDGRRRPAGEEPAVAVGSVPVPTIEVEPVVVTLVPEA